MGYFILSSSVFVVVLKAIEQTCLHVTDDLKLFLKVDYNRRCEKGKFRHAYAEMCTLRHYSIENRYLPISYDD